jgi:hypothetical protein
MMTQIFYPVLFTLPCPLVYQLIPKRNLCTDPSKDKEEDKEKEKEKDKEKELSCSTAPALVPSKSSVVDWVEYALVASPKGITLIGGRSKSNGQNLDCYKLYGSYVGFCTKNGIIPISIREFTAKLLEACLILGIEVFKIRNSKGTGIKGLTISAESSKDLGLLTVVYPKQEKLKNAKKAKSETLDDATVPAPAKIVKKPKNSKKAKSQTLDDATVPAPTVPAPTVPAPAKRVKKPKNAKKAKSQTLDDGTIKGNSLHPFEIID